MNTTPNLLDQDEPDVDTPAAAVVDDEPDIDIPPPIAAVATGPAIVETALVPVALMEVLPADFPLPALIRFVPDGRLKAAAEQASAYALAVDVAGPEGVQRADLALTALRASQKAIEEHFKEPTSIANQLHKSLTGKCSEWLSPGRSALDTVSKRAYAEQQRLQRIADEARRVEQEEANRVAREVAKREAEAAAKNQAPPQVVQELERRAETATAPPVAAAASAPPKLAGSTPVTTWKARPQGTPADAEPNPRIAEMTVEQLAQARVLLRAILDNRAPITAIEICYATLNGRAKADKSTFNIPGFEAFADGGLRAKSSRAVR